jgi:hypothetical protein
MTHVNALADGTRPTAIAGFSPTYHWPMTMTGSQELNIAGTRAEDAGSVAGTPLTANGSPTTVMGLGYLGSPPPEVGSELPLDVIIW